MFGNSAVNYGQPKTEVPLVIVCDEKDIAYANYLIQLIGQKDDESDKVVGIVDDSVSAAIYTTKFYLSNLPNIPSKQHTLFIGHSSVAKEQQQTVQDKFSKMGMHYGWLGKRAVLYVDDPASEYVQMIKLKESREHYDEFLAFSREHGVEHTDALHAYARKQGGFLNEILPVAIGAPKMLFDRNKAISEIKMQQYRTLEKVFYENGLRQFMEG